VPTHDTTKFSYNLGAGLRYDYGRAMFRAVVSEQWMDTGNYGSSARDPVPPRFRNQVLKKR
jgi:hypothetical protein